MQERHGIRVVQYNLLGNYCCKCEKLMSREKLHCSDCVDCFM